jgi:hypothetical protein
MKPTEEQHKSLADQVKELEAKAKEHEEWRCGEVRATLLVNFGCGGRTVPGLVNKHMSTFEMLMIVLRHYHDATKEEPKYPRVFKDHVSGVVCVFDGPESRAKRYDANDSYKEYVCNYSLKWHESYSNTKELFGTDREGALKEIEKANKWPRVFVDTERQWVMEDEKEGKFYVDYKYIDPSLQTCLGLSKLTNELFGKERQEILNKIEQMNKRKQQPYNGQCPHGIPIGQPCEECGRGILPETKKAS